MTDDFELFQDQSGDDPVDADIALITAYLARELSPVQIVAVEDRLASDKAFREKVNPILEAWVLPSPLMAVHAGQGPLSRDEVEAGWNRYVGEHAELDAHEGPRLVVEGAQRKRRKISMTRIAAGIAAITLPVFALAQVVVSVAKHPDVPGPSVAREMVAPFVVEAPPAPEAKAPQKQPETPPPAPEDIRVGRQLEKLTTTVQRATPVSVPAAESVTTTAPAPAVASIANPDRAKIAALLNAHMPEVVRRDTAADFAVIVLNAADNYVWSTYGNWAVQIVVGGDKRTPGERADYNLKNATVFNGTFPVTGGAGGGVARDGGGGGAGGSAIAGMLVRDSALSAVGYGRGRGGVADSNLRVMLDSVSYRLRTARDSTGRVALRPDTMAAVARVGGGGGARGGGGAGGAVSAVPTFTVTGLDSGSYVVGFPSPRAIGGVAVQINEAAGLQDPGRGESGIQGLKASSITMGETYLFRRGELDARSQALRVVVVHLAPGVSWTGR